MGSLENFNILFIKQLNRAKYQNTDEQIDEKWMKNGTIKYEPRTRNEQQCMKDRSIQSQRILLLYWKIVKC